MFVRYNYLKLNFHDFFVPSPFKKSQPFLIILPVRGATTATSDVTTMWSILHIGKLKG